MSATSMTFARPPWFLVLTVTLTPIAGCASGNGHGGGTPAASAAAAEPPPPPAVPFSCGGASAQAARSAAVSPLFADFVEARAAGREPVLPDFSYAGYRFSEVPLPDVAKIERRFVVTSFGAVPNDDGYDDAGIQAAIVAAERAGGGVVFFPAGRYRLSPSEDDSAVIRISANGVVLKGAGAGPGGTELFMDKMKRAFLFRIGPQRARGQTLARVVADAARESFTVTVDDASKLVPGQWIEVAGGGAAYNEAHWGALWPFPAEWSRMHKSGNGFGELHRVKAVDGTRVTLGEPLHFTIKASAAEFSLRAVTMLEEIGIEDIRFTGNWASYPETFVHHKDAIHDTGWSGVHFDHVANGWVRRCEFRDFNQALQSSGSAAMTFEALRFSGKKGHVSVHVRRGYGMLTKDSVDDAGHHHGPGLGYWGAGTVYLRHKMRRDQSIDSHSGSPYATLFDDVTGGVLSGNGGPGANLPHHGRHLVFWNFVHGASAAKKYDFWSTGKRVNNTFARPIFAGFVSATPVSFDDEANKVEANESFGRRVAPGSLFEAQLALRLCGGDKPSLTAAR